MHAGYFLNASQDHLNLIMIERILINNNYYTQCFFVHMHEQRYTVMIIMIMILMAHLNDNPAYVQN